MLRACLARWGASSVTVPTFMVAGAARSGTTALVEGLRRHPLVFITSPKEPHYFALHGTRAHFTGPGDDLTINKVVVSERQAYLRLYPRQHQFYALGEGSVSTLYYHDHSIPEILALNPDMRIVLILREPVARAFSSFTYMRARGYEKCPDLVTAIDEEPQRRQDGWHHMWHYTGMSRYADGVGALQESLGVQRVGVWFYDDMGLDPQGLIRDVLRFLEVPVRRGGGGEVLRVNVSGVPKSAAVQRAFFSARRHPRLRRSVKRFTTYAFREQVRRSNLSRNYLSDDVRTKLAPMFQDDLRRLARIVPEARQPSWLSIHAAPSG